MPTPLELTPQAEGTAAEIRAWIATLKRMRPRDSAIEEAIEAAEEEQLRRKAAEAGAVQDEESDGAEHR